MKYVAAFIAVIFAFSSASATSLDEIVKLSQLKSSDELILRLIQENPPAKRLTAKDVIYLKKNGVSESVIRRLMDVRTPASSGLLPPPAGKSYKLSNNVRYYYTTTQDGARKLVVTNLDENGKRMGPPPAIASPTPVQQPIRQANTNALAPIRIIVQQERDSRAEQYPNRSWDGPYRYERFRSYRDFYPYEYSSFGWHVFPQFFVAHRKFGHPFGFQRGFFNHRFRFHPKLHRFHGRSFHLPDFRFSHRFR